MSLNPLQASFGQISKLLAFVCRAQMHRALFLCFSFSNHCLCLYTSMAISSFFCLHHLSSQEGFRMVCGGSCGPRGCFIMSVRVANPGLIYTPPCKVASTRATSTVAFQTFLPKTKGAHGVKLGSFLWRRFLFWLSLFSFGGGCLPPYDPWGCRVQVGG